MIQILIDREKSYVICTYYVGNILLGTYTLEIYNITIFQNVIIVPTNENDTMKYLY